MVAILHSRLHFADVCSYRFEQLLLTFLLSLQLMFSSLVEGVRGIGPVNAIEVVNAFPEEDGLFVRMLLIDSECSLSVQACRSFGSGSTRSQSNSELPILLRCPNCLSCRRPSPPDIPKDASPEEKARLEQEYKTVRFRQWLQLAYF